MGAAVGLTGFLRHHSGTDHQSKYYNASRESYPTSTFIKRNKLNGLSSLRLRALFVDRIEWTYEISMPVWTCFALLKYDLAEESTIHLNPIEAIWSQLSHRKVSGTGPEKDSLMAFGIAMTAGLLGTGPAGGPGSTLETSVRI